MILDGTDRWMWPWIEVTAATVNGKVATVNGKVATVNGKVATVNGKVATVSSKVATVSSKVLMLTLVAYEHALCHEYLRQM
jgi:uncharacterized protein YlzI (FlbEa/FlbD family)